MEIKKFLKRISPYVLVNMSILKRLSLADDMRTLKEFRDYALNNNYLDVHEYENSRCFSISAEGFKLLDIPHQPSLQFTETQADLICRNNHLRIGFEQSLKPLNIDLKWVTGGKFAKSPLYIKHNRKEHHLQPTSAAILRDKSNKHRVYLTLEYNELERLNSELYLYSKYEAKGLHIKRFYLDPQAEMRIIVLVQSYKQAWQIYKRIKNAWYNKILFLPTNRVQVDHLLSRDVFLSADGQSCSIIT